MKRTGGLFARILGFENLLAAERRAARGKQDRASVGRFEFHLERELIALQEELTTGTYRPGRFFASVDHAVLRGLLACLFKEPELLALLDCIIAHGPPDAEHGRGLPIGNLTSQHFANLYLGEVDHYLKERLRVKGYLRYMDDLLLFADDKPSLHRLLAEIRGFLADPLHLALKEQATRIAPVGEGIPYLGFHLYPGTIRLNQRTRRRFRRQVRAIERAHQSGRINLRALGDHGASLFAHVGHADSYRLRRQVVDASIIDG